MNLALGCVERNGWAGRQALLKDTSLSVQISGHLWNRNPDADAGRSSFHLGLAFCALNAFCSDSLYQSASVLSEPEFSFSYILRFFLQKTSTALGMRHSELEKTVSTRRGGMYDIFNCLHVIFRATKRSAGSAANSWKWQYWT